MTFVFKTLKTVRDYEKAVKPPLSAKSPQDIRRAVRIAVVDDRDFSPLTNLQQHQFDITHLHDIETTETIQPYPVILMDLQGVGLSLHPHLQGAHLIKEIKKNFPEKFVIAYTGGAEPDILALGVEVADKYTQKDTSIDDWCDILDEGTRAVADPIVVWRKTLHRLIDEEATPLELASLEDALVRSLLENPSSVPQRLQTVAKRLKLSPNLLAIINSLAANAIFALIG